MYRNVKEIQLKTIETEKEFDTSEWSSEDRTAIRKLSKLLNNPQSGDLWTGKHLVEAQRLCEKYLDFARFLPTVNKGVGTARTAYRRIKTYEKACEIWPQDVVDAAIERHLVIVGRSENHPMGVFEELVGPPKNLTPEKIEEYLTKAEIEARGQANGGDASPYDVLKDAFQKLSLLVRKLPVKNRAKFLTDLVGLEMTLLGVTEAQTFEPASIPSEFWPTLNLTRTADSREKTRKAALERWRRVKRNGG